MTSGLFKDADAPAALPLGVLPARRRNFLAKYGWPVALPVGVAIVVVAAWQIYVATVNASLVPTPVTVAEGFWSAATTSGDWSATGRSWLSLAMGFGIAAVGGVILGLLLGWNRALDRSIGVYVDIALVMPEIVLMPIILIALGVTMRAEVAVIVLFSAPYVIMPIRNGVRSMPREWLDLYKSLCATRPQVWRHLLLPASREMIGTGLRIGLGHALTGLLIVELTLVALGIGNVVIGYQSAYDFGSMFGYILLVMCQVFLLMGLISLIEARSRYS